MLAEIAIIEEATSGVDCETFSRNQQAIRVVLYGLAVIGEAVASCLTELQAADPKVPWAQIRGMRNMVIHEDCRVDIDMIGETLQVDLPMLKRSLLNIQKSLTD